MGGRCRGKVSDYLIYHQELGARQSDILAAAREAGVEIRGRAAAPPELPPEGDLFLRAWQELHTCRPPGGYYQIPWTAIALWASTYRVDLETLQRIVWAIDARFLAWMREQEDD